MESQHHPVYGTPNSELPLLRLCKWLVANSLNSNFFISLFLPPPFRNLQDVNLRKSLPNFRTFALGTPHFLELHFLIIPETRFNALQEISQKPPNQSPFLFSQFPTLHPPHSNPISVLRSLQTPYHSTPPKADTSLDREVGV